MTSNKNIYNSWYQLRIHVPQPLNFPVFKSALCQKIAQCTNCVHIYLRPLLLLERCASIWSIPQYSLLWRNYKTYNTEGLKNSHPFCRHFWNCFCAMCIKLHGKLLRVVSGCWEQQKQLTFLEVVLSLNSFYYRIVLVGVTYRTEWCEIVNMKKQQTRKALSNAAKPHKMLTKHFFNLT